VFETTDTSSFEVEVKWVPVSTAAKLLGVSKQRVHELTASGALARVDMDGTVLVGRRSIESRLRQLRRIREA